MKNVTEAVVFLSLLGSVSSWGSSDKVLLRDVDVITLYSGKMTNARRTSAIKQLRCTGGSAASYFKPQVVQCYNRGSDGNDVQWECKTDMDNAYRFGTIQVSCEGYDYPDDPYILKGSCGLEYTLDLTKEGHDQHNRGGGHNYYQHKSSPYYGHRSHGSNFGNLVFLGIIVLIVYGIYKTCVSPRPVHGDGDTPRYPRAQPSAPPPPGFRPEYTTGAPPSYDDCTSGHYSTVPPTGGAAPNTGGGFWSGAATGGLLGYLFGSRTRTHYHTPHYGPRWGNGWGTGWGTGWGNGWGTGWGNGWGSGWGTGGGWGNSGSRSYSSRSSSSSSSSSGTRTASGFGGTSRR